MFPTRVHVQYHTSLCLWSTFTQLFTSRTLDISPQMPLLKKGYFVAEITMSQASSSIEEQPAHQLDSYLTKFTGKGADAPGKRIVIGVDGSDPSNYACDWFFEHLWSTEDYVVLLSCPDQHDVVKGSGKNMPESEADYRLKEGGEKVIQELERLREKLLQHEAHGKVRLVFAKNPGDAILKTADEETADVIVIGCRDRSSIIRTIVGTVSDYIVQHATVPVVVCRRKSPRRKSSFMLPTIPSESLTTVR